MYGIGSMLIAMKSIEMEPQINADERGLIASSLDIQDAIFKVNNIFRATFGKDRELHLNLRGKIKDTNHLGIKRKPLAIIDDRFDATNLRLSAFICGLNKSQKTRQQNFILELENQGLLFVNLVSAFKNIHLRRNLR